MSYININKRLSKLKDDLDEILSKKEVRLEDVFNRDKKNVYMRKKEEDENVVDKREYEGCRI